MSERHRAPGIPLAQGIYTRAVKRWPSLANLTGINDGWAVTHYDDRTVRLKRGASEISMDRFHAGIFLSEILAWGRQYLPEGGVSGKEVLDVGAGCGETAAFYFARGAKRVTCVEPDTVPLLHLRGNVERNGWDAPIVPDPFNNSQLSISHDFLKLDAEGSERLLLEYGGSLGPCRIELHPGLIGHETCDDIKRKFGLRTFASSKTEEVCGLD